MSDRPDESPGETQGKAMVPKLKPGPRGGMLWAGPPANPVAGPGRPPNVVKAAARKLYEERLPVLAGIADGDVRTRLVGICKACGAEDAKELTDAELRASVPSVADRIMALRTLAAFSDLKDSGLPDDGLLQDLGQAVVDVVGADPWRAIEDRWVDILSRRIR